MTAITDLYTGPMPIAASAIKRSQANLAADAHVVANSRFVTSTDAMVDAKQQVLYTKAAARIITTTDNMIASLLDTRA